MSERCRPVICGRLSSHRSGSPASNAKFALVATAFDSPSFPAKRAALATAATAAIDRLAIKIRRANTAGIEVSTQVGFRGKTG
jgi:hypothetical protein